MNFKPNSDRVLVKKSEFKSKAGLIMPEIVESHGPYLAKVVSVGPGRVLDGVLVRPDFDEGDSVLVDHIAGLKIEVENESYVLVRAEEILGKFLP